MKILLLAPHPFFQARGSPIAERALLRVLEDHYDVDVLTYHEGRDPDFSGVTIHRIPALPGLSNIRPGFSFKKLICDAMMAVKCLRLLRRNDYDLLHAVEESTFIALLAGRLANVPYIYDMDSSLVEQLQDRFPFLEHFTTPLVAAERRAVRSSLGVVAVCRSLQETALAYDGDKKVAKLEDVSLLDSMNGEGESLARVIGSDGPIVLYVGNLESYQGIDLLLEGFRKTAAEVPAARLVIIGGSDERVAHYRARADEIGLADRIHLLGPRPLSMLRSFLRQADVLASPRIEGRNTPLKIFPYLDSGRPLVATRLLTHTQVLDDEIAHLVEPEPEAFGEGLVALLKDPRRGKRLASAARQRVQEEFTPAAFRRKVLEFYDWVEERVTGRAGSRGARAAVGPETRHGPAPARDWEPARPTTGPARRLR